MSEESFWSKEIKPNIGHFGHFERIESRSTSPGQPDLNYCIESHINDCELKFGFADKMPEIKPTQFRWFRRRVAAGGTPWMLAKIMVPKISMSHYLLIPGSRVAMLRRKNLQNWLDQACLRVDVSCAEKPGHHFWKELLYWLKGEYRWSNS